MKGGREGGGGETEMTNDGFWGGGGRGTRELETWLSIRGVAMEPDDFLSHTTNNPQTGLSL